MPARSSWKGYLKLSLVSVPVKAYTSTSSGGGQVRLNQLHEECNSRIQYKKTCPVHGEVGNDEIVSGYEFAKGQYVVINTDELEKLRTESDRSINVDGFVKSDTIDDIYHSGKSYYLVPDGPVGQKPYALIRQAMLDQDVHAIAQVVISGKEQLVELRPLNGLLSMGVLNYATQVKKPESFEDELVETDIDEQELDLTKRLIDGLFKEDFDIGQYHDEYTEKLTKLVEAKVEGKELVTPPEQEEPQVINLMEALQESVNRVKVPEKKRKKAETKKRPAKKAAASKKRRKTKKKKEQQKKQQKKKSG